MAHKITLLPGDGIGPEVTQAAVRAVEATGVDIKWESMLAGAPALEASGDVLPEAVLDSLRTNRVGLKGPITTPIGKGFSSVNVSLRRALDLYANFRPSRILPGVTTPFSGRGLDLIVFRENTEGLYSGLEHEVVQPPPRAAVLVQAQRVEDDLHLAHLLLQPVQRLVACCCQWGGGGGGRGGNQWKTTI